MKSHFALIVITALSALSAQAQGPPSLCKPCLFYGGDYKPGDPNSLYFYDQNTLTEGDTQTYGAIIIPRNHSVEIEGILFQIQLFQPKLDPNGVTWEIRADVTQGSGGTLIASGQGPVAMEPTGRTGDGPEYTLAVKVNPPVSLSGGTKGTVYWFNLTPQCTNKNDIVCSENQYGVSNTVDQTNSFRGGLQAAAKIYLNSLSGPFTFDWEWACNITQNGTQCGYLSFGLIGTVIQ